ncbi:UNVERIFIED_CONTAM: hypothetical protein Sangu_2446300 [Sesamum angustifolium]|uniref:Uncharacterized protein n=1 Tax=Sesamum angustifolium TaxID=2727405 RepID=A0AAW2L0N9_9LAMI
MSLCCLMILELTTTTYSIALQQDTVKYMENQVQKVGVSVKKFYSEVMEDLLHPSCVDPMKVPYTDSFFDPYAHTDINKKQMPSLLDNHTDLKRKENEDEVISHVTSEKGSPLNGHYAVNTFSPRSPGVLVQDKCSELSSGKTKKIGLNLRGKRVRLLRLKKGDSECSSSCRGSSTESICTSNSFSNTSSGNAESGNKEVVTFNEGISINDGSSGVSRNICHGDASDKEVRVSNEDNFDMEVIKNEEFAQLRLEISEPVQRANLEESCVLVEGYVPQGTGRNSYKKKIRRALLSKLRSTKQRNECTPNIKIYLELTTWWQQFLLSL